MSANQIELDIASRELVANGWSILANAVRVTFEGDVVIDKSWSAATINDDGVMVAKQIDLKETPDIS